MSCRLKSPTSCVPLLADVAGEIIEAVRTVPDLRAADGRPVRRRHPRGGAGGAAPFPRRDRGGRSVPALGRLQRARPRRDARGPQSRVAAQRLPGRRARRLATVCGGRPCRPDSSRRRCTCSPSRCSPISMSCRPSPPRGTRWSSRLPRARPSWQTAPCADARPRAAARPRRRAGCRQRGRLAVAAPARGPRDRWRAARARPRLRFPPDAIADSIGEIRESRSFLIPTTPTAPLGTRARDDRIRGRGPGLGTSVEWPDAAVSFARAHAALGLADGRDRTWSSPVSAPANCCCAATRGSQASSRTTGSPRWQGLSPG